MNETRRFYDELADTYDLIYADWDASVAAQGVALDRLLTSREAPRAGPVLDCSCGIGTQTLGLAALGWRMTGSDPSPTAVARARHEASSRSLGVEFIVADMRALPFPGLRRTRELSNYAWSGRWTRFGFFRLRLIRGPGGGSW